MHEGSCFLRLQGKGLVTQRGRGTEREHCFQAKAQLQEYV